MLLTLILLPHGALSSEPINSCRIYREGMDMSAFVNCLQVALPGTSKGGTIPAEKETWHTGNKTKIQQPVRWLDWSCPF